MIFIIKTLNKMKRIDIKNPILESVYSYYNNGKNYIKENLNEEGRCIVVDDTMFNDIIDMVETGTYTENEPGHILIPTEGGYTLNIEPNGDMYLDDDSGNELEAQIDKDKLDQILMLINSKDYDLVSENKNNPFTNVEQDPESGFITFTKKGNVPMDDALKGAHNAVEKSKEKFFNKKNSEPDPSLQDRRNDTEYMDKVHDYWNDRNSRPEPHGYGTSGTLPMFNESTDEADMYDPAAEKPDMTVYPPKGLGINESRIAEIVSRIIKNKIR